MGGIEFLKGHGTQNDFVVLPDPDGRLDLTVGRVRALCDRRRGLGADGVLRVVRAGAMPSESSVDGSMWFMDYRNADGSIAEMCGNGVRVFARYLTEAGLVYGREFVIGSRAGARAVVCEPDGAISVQMGPVRTFGRTSVSVGDARYDAMCVDVGNPHAVSFVDSHVDGLELSRIPGYDAGVFPDGANFEFVNVVGDGVLRMRVYERGVGETRSCGTGTVAAAYAYLARESAGTGRADVLVPGGRVSVHIPDGESSTLTGPAEIVARGELDEQWWSSLG